MGTLAKGYMYARKHRNHPHMTLMQPSYSPRRTLTLRFFAAEESCLPAPSGE